MFLFPPSRGPNDGGGLLSNVRKFIKPRVVAVAAETYNNNNNINIQLYVCVCVFEEFDFSFVLCPLWLEVEVIGVVEDLWRSPTGSPPPLFTGTNWTTHYRPQTTNEGLVCPTGGSLLNARCYIQAQRAAYLSLSRNPMTYKKYSFNDVTKTWSRFGKT